MTLPPPSAPLSHRVTAAFVMLVTLPLWWTMFAMMFAFLYVMVGVLFALCLALMLLVPVAALFGVEESKEETFKVKVPKDKAKHLRLVVEEEGGKVEG